MTNIKASRKGTRLNDIRYFRLPLSNTRKRMTVIRVLPRINTSALLHVVQDASSRRLPSALGIGTRAQDRGKTVISKQSSIEIAFVTCRGEETNQNKEGHQDVCVETERIVFSSSHLFLTEQQKDEVITIISQYKKSAEFLSNEDDRDVAEKANADEKFQTKRSCENVGHRKQNCGDRAAIETKGREKAGNWWKDSGQTILQFFAKILGKRAIGKTGMVAKGPTDRVLPSIKRVKRVSKDGTRSHRHRRGITEEGIRLRRVSNGYIATRAFRHAVENRRGSIAVEYNSHDDQQYQQEHRPSILVRQIQRTRDKNLRVVLLERELRARLPRKDVHPIASGIVNVRQLSSPLC